MLDGYICFVLKCRHLLKRNMVLAELFLILLRKEQSSRKSVQNSGIDVALKKLGTYVDLVSLSPSLWVYVIGYEV